MEFIKHCYSPTYNYVFYSINGVSVRTGETKELDAKYAPHPELVDMSITNKCNNRCKYCYMSSNPNGEDAPMFHIQQILNELSQFSNMSQIALGGGDPMLHSHFCDILRIIRQNKIVPNYSTASMPNEEILLATKEYCGAVAVSFHGIMDDTLKIIDKFMSHDINTNVHIVLGAEPEEDVLIFLAELIKNYNELNGVIFLRFKPIGRAENIVPHKYDYFFSLLKNKNVWLKNIPLGIDSCLVPIAAQHLPNESEMFYDRCEAGRFSLFIDAVNFVTKPCSFDNSARYDLTILSIQQAWDQMNKTEKDCQLNLWE